MPSRLKVALAVAVAAASATGMTGHASAATPPSCQGHKATIVVTAAHHVVRGTARGDVIVAPGAGDTIYGGAGNDLICAGAAKAVYGGAGNDRILARGGAVVHGGPGNDSIWLGAGNGAAYGDDGDDVLTGGSGQQLLAGGAGADRLTTGAHGRFTVRGGAGADVLRIVGGSGDVADGGAGADRVSVPAALLATTTVVPDPADVLNGAPESSPTSPTTPTTPTTPTSPTTPTTPTIGTGPLVATLTYDGSRGPVFATSDPGFGYQCCTDSIFRTDVTMPAGDRITSWNLAFGDESPDHHGLGGPVAVLSHFYDQQGLHTATLTVHDLRGQSATSSVVVGLDLQPTVTVTTAASDTSGNLTVSTAGTHANGGTTVASFRMAWGDGTFTTGTGAPPSSLHHTYARQGVYGAILMVVDSAGQKASGAASYTYSDGGLHANLLGWESDPLSDNYDQIEVATGRIHAGRSIGFSAATSAYPGSSGFPFPPGGETFTFDYGDGSAAFETQYAGASHTYTTAGKYTASVTVSDGTNQDTATMVVDVVGGAMTFTATPHTARIALGTGYELHTSATAPAGDALVAYSVSWGDDLSQILPPVTAGPVPSVLSHTYAAPGLYYVQLTSRDNHGGVREDSAEVAVFGTAPSFADGERWYGTTAMSGPESATNLGTYVYVDDVLPSLGAQLTTFDVDFGDGSAHAQGTFAGNGPLGTSYLTEEHAYTAAGEYDGTITARDSTGATGVWPFHVSVIATHPVLTLTVSNPSPHEGDLVTVTPTFDAGAGAIADNYQWSANGYDGSTSFPTFADPALGKGPGAPPPFTFRIYKQQGNGSLAVNVSVQTDHGYVSAGTSVQMG
ncbi:MAG TPA: PKD domain-containing protein [Mycobacteriales bacterium]|nr:PKD domain-containing protein [Mycobacteriales bacterium]